MSGRPAPARTRAPVSGSRTATDPSVEMSITFDQVTPWSVEQVDEDTIRIDGTFPIDDFNEQFRTELPVEDYHTIAGFVFGQLGRAAEAGDEVSHDGMVFRVEEVEGQRIDKLAVTFERRREERQRDEAEPEA